MGAHKFSYLFGLGKKKNNFIYFAEGAGGEAPAGGTDIDAAKKEIEALRTRLQALEAQLVELEDAKRIERKDHGEPIAKKLTETPILPKNSTVEALVTAAGLEFMKRGKKIGWTFEFKSDKGKPIKSKRNFINSQEFRNGLLEKDTDGNLVNNTADKVKLYCFKYLLSIIEKDGSIKDNRYNVVAFKKSNGMLKTEIKRLSGQSEAPAPVAATAAVPAPAPAPAPTPASPPAAPTATPAKSITGDGKKTEEAKAAPAKVESEWTQEPKLTPDSTLVTSKIYQINKNIRLRREDHHYSPFTQKHTVALISDKVRTVEGKRYVQVGIVETGAIGWIPKEDLIIPEEDKMMISDQAKVENPKETTEKLKILGTYTVNGDKNGSQLLKEIFTQFPDLERKLNSSGISKPAYIQLLLSHREGNKLQIIEPTKTMLAKVTEFEAKKHNAEYIKIQSEENERIFKHRKEIMSEERFLTDKTLGKYIHDDELWNNLWDKRGEQADQYIDGIEKVIDVFKQFGLSDTQVRDELRELLQIGINEKVTFEEIFDRYAKDPKFKGIKYEKGDLSDFTKELNDLEAAVAPWKTAEGREKIKKIRNFHSSLDQVRLVIKAAEEEGRDFRETPEFMKYEKQSKETETIRREYIDAEIPVKAKRLDHLRTNVLNPITKLLDAITAMEVRVSKKTDLTDKFDSLISELPGTTEIPQLARFATLKSLIEGTEKPIEDYDISEKEPSVTVSDKALTKFRTIIKDLDDYIGIDHSKFSNTDILKIVFQLYSLETLAKEKCLNKIQNSKGLVLVDLPKSFNFKNPIIIEYFAHIQKGEDVYKQQEFIKGLRENIDDNAKVLARLNSIFGNDRGLDRDFSWREKLLSVFSGEDTREIPITMADIGARKFSKPSKDFLNKYMSGKSEISYIMGKISRLENGATIYNPEKLTKELNKRLNLGINNLFMNDEFKQIREALFARHKTEDKAELYKILSKKVENFHSGLDAETIAVIRLGTVINQIVEAHPEQKKIDLSASKEARAIQKAAIKAGYPQEDVKMIEDKLLGGIVVSPQGGFSATTGVNVDIGHGFTATIGVSAGQGGALPGAALSHTGKYGETKLTVGIHGSGAHAGAHGNVEIPLSKETSLALQGAAGISAIGFYATGGIGVMRDFDREHANEFKEQLANKGFEKVEALRKKGASAAEMVNELIKVPKYGPEFKAAKESCKLSPKALMEVYEKLRTEIDADIKAKNTPGGITFKFAGAGVAAGIVGPTAFVVPYVSFVINERRVGIRSEVAGQAKMDQVSETELNQALLKELGANAEITHETTGDTGQIAIGPDGNLAILEGKAQITDLRKFSKISQMKDKLKEINIEIASNPQDHLNRLNIATDGDLKLVADPNLNISFTRLGNKILFSGGNEAISKLIITREDFVYTNKKSGAQKLTVLTIKENPLRNRQQLEKESPYFIYQRQGYEPEIRSGIAERGKSAIKLYNAILVETKGLPETVSNPDQEAFETWRKRTEKATNTASHESFRGKPRKGLIEAMVKKFLNGKRIEKGKTNKELYRELSTIGEKNYNPDKLNQILSKIVDETDFKTFQGPELALLHIELIHESFIDARNKMKTFEKHAKFAKKVLTKHFETIAKEITPAITSAPADMAEQILKDIREGLDFNDPKQIAKINSGAYMLSVVGTMKIPGLRGTSYLGSETDKANGIFNLRKYSPGDGGIRGDIGKVMLELQSPLNESDDSKFMKSKLALKLAAHDGLYLVLGKTDAEKLTLCYEQKEVKPENKAAFERFKDIVLKVREAQNAGRNFVELPGNYLLKIKTTVGAGAYEKCTNPTMIVTEDIAIWSPKSEGMAAQTTQRGSVRYREEVARETILGAIAIAEQQEEKKTPPPAEKEEPEVGSGGEVKVEAGDTKGGASQQVPNQDIDAAKGMEASE